MNDAAAPTHTIAANLGWFGLIYVVALVAATLLAEVLQDMGVTLPSAGLGIGIYAGVVALAGNRFAERREWTGRDRDLLSLGYLAIAIVVSCAFTATLLLLEPDDFLTLIPRGGSGIIVGFFFVAALIYYGVGRLALMFIARRRDRDAWQNQGSKR